MNFVAIQKDSLVKDVLMTSPECHPEFVALGVDLKAAMTNGLTVEQACKEHNFDPDLFVRYLVYRIDDIA